MTTTDPPVAGNGDEDERRQRCRQHLAPTSREIASGSSAAPASRWTAGVSARWRSGSCSSRSPSWPIVFTIVGIHTNQQDDRLHHDGVPVTFTVTGCLGLLGGSGSNAAGYSCRGTYTLDGKHYSGVQLPGDSFHRPGSTVAAIAVPGDPALVSPASIVATEHSSAGAFVLPAVLAAVLLVLVALLLVLRRRRTPRAGGHSGAR